MRQASWASGAAALPWMMVILAGTASAQMVTAPREKIIVNEQAKTLPLGDGAAMTVISGAAAQMAFGSFQAGASIPMHNHPEEQITHVLSGKMQLTVDGRTHLLAPGMSIVIPAYVPHGGEALEDTTTVEAFGPLRVNWLGSSN